jgi:hypothetical protein
VWEKGIEVRIKRVAGCVVVVFLLLPVIIFE